MEELLIDKDTYCVVKKNPIKNIENKLNSLLKEWLQHNYITKQQYYKFRSSDSILPKAYGLPKIHKINTPFRIIVSSVNTALYQLAAYFHKVISESIGDATSHITSSFELHELICERQVPQNDVLISFDVISLFTNVPIDLALDGISNRWTSIKRNTKISKSDFLYTIEFVLSSSFFTFNNIIYRQTFGTPIGSPLSPIIADVVMRNLETSCLNGLDYSLAFYVRYVDDITYGCSFGQN